MGNEKKLELRKLELRAAADSVCGCGCEDEKKRIAEDLIIALDALGKINEFDKDPFNHATDPKKCSICIARNAVKKLTQSNQASGGSNE